MPEPTHDPIRDLESFGTGGIHVNPLAPDQVRRLGDRRRARRRATLLIAASVLAVVGGIIPVTLAMTNDDTAPAPPMITPTPTPTPSPTPTPTPSPTQEPLGRGNIPADFPLDIDAGDYTGDGGTMLGPDPSVEILPLELCGEDLLPTGSAKGRLAFSSTGPEVREERSLVTYEDERSANVLWAAVAERAASCTSWDDNGVRKTLTGIDPGYDQAVVSFAVTQEPLGGTVYVVAQVGSAILTLAHHGELGPETARATAEVLDEVRGKLAPRMCLFAFRCDTWLNNASVPARVSTYPGRAGIHVLEPADLASLRGASDEFLGFVSSLLPAARAKADAGCDGQSGLGGVYVAKYRSDGFALGTSWDCGGYQVVWAHEYGQWRQVLTTQDVVRCADLLRLQIPESLLTGCLEESGRFRQTGDFGPSSVDGLSLGMTEEAVIAAGGSVAWPDGQDRCGYVYLPGTIPNGYRNADGYISQRGVESLSALTAPPGEAPWIGRMLTPQGIGTGATRAEVETAYPGGRFELYRTSWLVATSPGYRYRFIFDEDSTVSSFMLEANDQKCYV